MSHPALGWLQGGKAPPQEYYLDRLQRLHPQFVIAWRMGDSEQTGTWVLFERMGDPVWREAGVERKARYDANPLALSSGIALSIWAQCEGLHWWGEWPNGGVFSELWFQDVARGLKEEREGEARARVEASIRQTEAGDVWDEAKANPAYLAKLEARNPELCAMLDTMAREEFGRICRGRTLVSVAGKPKKKRVTA